MSLDVKWTIEVHIPQLDSLQQTLVDIGEKLMGEISGIQDAINLLVANQAKGQEDMNAHLTAIQQEIAQLGTNPTQAQLDHLAQQVQAAAAVSAKAGEDLRAMTEQVKGMVPGTPAPPTP